MEAPRITPGPPRRRRNVPLIIIGVSLAVLFLACTWALIQISRNEGEKATAPLHGYWEVDKAATLAAPENGRLDRSYLEGEIWFWKIQMRQAFEFDSHHVVFYGNGEPTSWSYRMKRRDGRDLTIHFWSGEIGDNLTWRLIDAEHIGQTKKGDSGAFFLVYARAARP